MGDLSMPCRRIGVSVGYRGGGELVVPLFENKILDVMVCGEAQEWETPEYVRDALHQGNHKAMIVIGHAESEMPGMKYLAQWLQENFPSVPVHFMPQEPLFKIH
jgi:NIF3 (NGG1p interacting factor 3).